MLIDCGIATSAVTTVSFPTTVSLSGSWRVSVSLFLVFLLLATGSLVIVVLEQYKKLRLMWPQNLRESQFTKAPYRFEFERPARFTDQSPNQDKIVEFKTRGKAGLLGSLLFHSGLLLIIVAGTLRVLFGAEAVVDLIETETLIPKAEVWAAQWPGVLARPLKLEYPLTLDKVKIEFYQDWTLKDLRAELTVNHSDGPKKKEFAINDVFKTKGARLFMNNKFGPAALLEWFKNGASIKRDAMLMESIGKGVFVGSIRWPDGTRTDGRAQADRSGKAPEVIKLRLMKDGKRSFLTEIRVGETVSLPDGRQVKLHGLPLWAQIRGIRDPELWLIYAGFILSLLGAVMIFTVIRVDTSVVVTRLGEKERVLVALKSQRFTPLFEDRFKRLVQDEGGLA